MKGDCMQVAIYRGFFSQFFSFDQKSQKTFDFHSSKVL